MAKTVSIVCEFNPIHKGHAELISNIRNKYGDCIIIAVMTGNFTQRGTPACYDKYVRAEAALECGVDIVTELPYPWSCEGVEKYARAGVSILAGLGAEALCFATETGDPDNPIKYADIKYSVGFNSLQKKAENTEREKGSASIFSGIMQNSGISCDLSGNEKLAGEYIHFASVYGINECIQFRRNEQYSATRIRDTIASDGIESCSDTIPYEAYGIFLNGIRFNEDEFTEYLYRYCSVNLEANDGISSFLVKRARESSSKEVFIGNINNKKYTLSRLRRELLGKITGVPSFKKDPGYTLVLSANQKGTGYLKTIRNKTDIKIITKPSDITDLAVYDPLLESWMKSDGLYACLSDREYGYFLKKKPYIKKQSIL